MVRRLLSFSLAACWLGGSIACSSTVLGTGAPIPSETSPNADLTPTEGPTASETPTDAEEGPLEKTPPPTSSENDDPTPSAALDVTGPWTGSLEGDTAYLELTQTGSYVSGKFCEAPPNEDCQSIYGGRFIDGHLTGAFSFFESGTQTVSFDLAIGGDGKTLSGDAESTKCSCKASVVLARAKQ